MVSQILGSRRVDESKREVLVGAAERINAVLYGRFFPSVVVRAAFVLVVELDTE